MLPTAVQRRELPAETKLHAHDFNQVIWNLLETSIKPSSSLYLTGALGHWNQAIEQMSHLAELCHILPQDPSERLCFPRGFSAEWRMSAPETNTHFCQKTNGRSLMICLQLLNNILYVLGSTAEFIFLSLNSSDLVSTTFNVKSYLASIFLKYTALFVQLFSRIVKVLKALNLSWALDKIYVSRSSTQINKMKFLHNFKQARTFFNEFISVFQIYWYWEQSLKNNAGDNHTKSISEINASALCILAVSRAESGLSGPPLLGVWVQSPCCSQCQREAQGRQLEGLPSCWHWTQGNCADFHCLKLNLGMHCSAPGTHTQSGFLGVHLGVLRIKRNKSLVFTDQSKEARYWY